MRNPPTPHADLDEYLFLPKPQATLQDKDVWEACFARYGATILYRTQVSHGGPGQWGSSAAVAQHFPRPHPRPGIW